jgi:site-specific DNA recombinase
VVRRIFELSAAGWSPRRIARALNAERIPPPRGRSWTWTAIYGSPRLGTGILNNRLYIGQVIWNKFRWERNPDTGTRVPRMRPREEWIVLDDETLRIVPQELWDAVHDRRPGERDVAPPRRTGRPGVYLFSGLLRCARCGARYIIRSHDRYACAGYLDRGPTVCGNAQTVRRQVVESRLLEVIEHELFAPEAIAYITERVNRELQALVRHRRSSRADRTQREAELRTALAELDRIRDAIRRGLISDLTREMLEEAEARVRRLRAELIAPAPAELRAVTVLPHVVAEKLQDLRRLLTSDVEEVRAILRELIGEVTLHPTPEGLVAELAGNIQGLLALGPQPLRVINMVAGGGFEPPTFGL